ncbi:MAG: nucleoside-triphosphatase [Burkholderiales bacterium]
MKALLLTGRPGIGKTTVIRRVADALKGERIAGIYTEELRSRGERTGFRIVTLDGRSRLMASIDIRSPHRVGKYGVDVSAVDAIAEATLAPHSAQVFLVDEIGKMECFSIASVEAVRRLLAANRLIMASVAFKGGGLVEEVKRLPRVVFREVTAQNRDRLPREVIQWVNEQLMHSDAERS